MGDLKMNLESKLKVALSFSNGKLKYYHYRSVNNFIFHLNNIKNETDKEKIYLLINEYLDIIKNEPNPDRNVAINFFENYVRPVGKYYEDDFNFVPMFSLWIASFWIITFLFIEYIFNLPFVVMFMTGFLIFIYYIYILVKRMNNKVYGFMW
jgi:hypothetical protein